jgi:hypothetical protein
MTALSHGPRGEGLAVSSTSTQVSVTNGWSPPRRQIGTRVTTPGALLTSSVVMGVLAVALLVAAIGFASTTNAASSRIVRTAGPLVVAAQELHIALATADASASTAFLEAGLESAEQRERYEAAVLDASRRVTSIADDPLDEATSDALSTVNDNLTVYAGLVETARANNRLGHPVGAAYLRDANDLMRAKILPAATDLFERAADALDREYDVARSRTRLAVLLAIAGVTLAALAVIQVFVARRTRRMINLGLAVATVAVAGLAIASVLVFETQRGELDNSQQRGADPLLIASAARILLLRSLNDENLDLIERGTDQAHMADFDAVRDVLGTAEAPGLIALAVGTSADANYAQYLTIHDEVRRLVEDGNTDAAISATLNELSPAERLLDAQLAHTVASATTRLDTEASEAHDSTGTLLALAVALPIAAVVTALAGLWVRRKEYR